MYSPSQNLKYLTIHPMRVLSSLAVLSVLFLFSQCRLPVDIDDEYLVANLRFSPSAFDSFKRNAELKYSLREPATVSIIIVKRDATNQEFLVKTLATNLRGTKGTHAITWLGDTDQRIFAPVGTYIAIVNSGKNRFETTVEVFHF